MYFERGNASYWYEVYGKGTPIMLLHGFTGNTRTWDTLVRQWQHVCQFIIIDLPGHGKTKTAKKTMEDCCNDIKHLLDNLSLNQVHMVGYSMGGRTALSFAMMYPEYIQSLVLESASPGLQIADDSSKRQKQDIQLAEFIKREGLEQFVSYWEKIPLISTQKRLPSDVQQMIRNIRLSQSKEGLALSLQYMGTGVQPSWWDTLSKCNHPVLLLAGEDDEKYVSINTYMHQALLYSQFSIVKEAGHAIHVEQSNIFGKLVMEYIFNIVRAADKRI